VLTPGDHFAREKVGQTMRDMLHAKYKSSNRSKKRRRKEIQAKQNEEIDDFLAMNCSDIRERVQQLTLTATTDGKPVDSYVVPFRWFWLCSDFCRQRNCRQLSIKQIVNHWMH
jgi:hypothetical protein